MNIHEVKFPSTLNSISQSRYDSKQDDKSKLNKRRINIANMTLRRRIDFQQSFTPLGIKPIPNLRLDTSNQMVSKRHLIKDMFRKPKEINYCDNASYLNLNIEPDQERQNQQGKLSMLQLHFKNLSSQKIFEIAKNVVPREHRDKSKAQIVPLSLSNRGSIQAAQKKTINEVSTQTYEQNNFKEFQFTQLLSPIKTNTISPREQTHYQVLSTTSMNRNYLIDEESSQQNNILKSILTIKRKNIMELIVQDKASKGEFNQDKLLNQYSHSMPRFKEHQQKKHDEYTYLKVLQLPYHWNDNYYQTQKTYKCEHIPTKYLVSPKRRKIRRKDSGTNMIQQQSHLTKPDINDSVESKPLEAKQLTEAQKFVYGDIRQSTQKKSHKRQQSTEQVGFQDQHEQQDMEDYFHYYVQQRID